MGWVGTEVGWVGMEEVDSSNEILGINTLLRTKAY